MKTNLLNKDPLTPGTCEWCGSFCELDDACCSLSCEAQLNRLEATQGRLVLRVLKRWRKHSGRKGSPGEGAFSEITQHVDRFLRNDRLRREKHQQDRRTEEAAAKAKKAAPKPTGRVESSSVAPNPPEEDWMAREGRLAQYGDLDGGAPQSEDSSKRGFQPK